MKKVCEAELRTVDAGAVYSYTRKCGLCGKKFTASAKYSNIFNLVGAVQAVYAKVNSRYSNHLATAH